MMGYNHALSGAAAWVAVASTTTSFPSLGLIQVSPWQLLTGALVCAGAALLPDLDHRGATASRSVPVAGRVAAGLINTASGGHRKGMHSLLAIVACWFVTGWIGTLTWAPSWWHQTLPAAGAFMIAAMLAFATRTLKIARSWPLAWILGGAGAAAMYLFLPDQLGWFQLCITVGFATHIVGDFLTIEGINWLWPLKIKAPGVVQSLPGLRKVWKRNGSLSLPILGRTGSLTERVLGAGLALYALAGVAAGIATGAASGSLGAALGA